MGQHHRPDLIPIAFTLVLGWSFSDDGGPTYVRRRGGPVWTCARHRIRGRELPGHQISCCSVVDNTPDNDCRLADAGAPLTVDAALARP
ncbi:MAG: hypothetical protein R2851_04855 [Caldilineaceae bacterium]